MNSLKQIWNGDKYAKFRRDHVFGTKGIKCTEQCDMKIIKDYI
jgi:hypothetical protein